MKKTVRISAMILTGIILLVLVVPFIYQQSVYLSEKIDKEGISKIEYVKYEGEPYRSTIVEKRRVANNPRFFNKILSQWENERVVLYFHPKYTSEVLFIYYKNGRILNAFIDGNKYGIDYGKVWVRTDIDPSYIREMKKVNLVERIQ